MKHSRNDTSVDETPSANGVSRRALLTGAAALTAGIAIGANLPRGGEGAEPAQPPVDQSDTALVGNETYTGEIVAISPERAKQLKANVLGMATAVFAEEGYTGLRQAPVLTAEAESAFAASTITLEYSVASKADVSDVTPENLDAFSIRYRAVTEEDYTPADVTSITTPIQGTPAASVDYTLRLSRVMSKQAEGFAEEEQYQLELLPGSVVYGLLAPGEKPNMQTVEELLETSLQTFGELAKQ